MHALCCVMVYEMLNVVMVYYAVVGAMTFILTGARGMPKRHKRPAAPVPSCSEYVSCCVRVCSMAVCDKNSERCGIIKC